MSPTLARLAALALVAPLLAHPAAADAGRITVTGRATIETPPDHATVTIGVASRGANPAAALDANSAAAARVIAAAREFGIAPADLATSSVSLSQGFTRGGASGSVPDGYRAENNVQVRLRDFGKLGELMRRTLDGGANAIGGVAFGLQDMRSLEVKAGADAVRDAVRRAQALAEAAGIRLGAIETIMSPPRTASGAIGFVPGLRAMAAPPPRSVPIEAGTIEVSAEVEVTWAVAQP